MAKLHHLAEELLNILPRKPSYPQLQTTIMRAILYASFSIATVLILLPCQSINGNLVPIFIFKGQPSIFHAFVVSVIFAFTGAFIALATHHKPRISGFCSFYSMVAAASAIAFLSWALFGGSQRLSHHGK